MIAIDISNERIVKEYIEGSTMGELVKNDAMEEVYIEQVREMAEATRRVGLNIDYFPTNFVGVTDYNPPCSTLARMCFFFICIAYKERGLSDRIKQLFKKSLRT